jgi:hypothetical protein
MWILHKKKKMKKKEDRKQGRGREKKKLFLCQFETSMVTICNEYSAVSVYQAGLGTTDLQRSRCNG